MSTEINYKFYLRIVLPSVLAIALFVISIFAIIIPTFEENMLERKKEMIGELTNAAWSVLDEYQMKVESGSISLNDAQKQAAGVIELMRYGSEWNDYFWIIDSHSYMVMHPFRPELNGTDLSNYEDPEGTLLFSEAVEMANNNGEGYIQYIWQWKNDTTRVGPKLTYVKAYPQWNWIIGTGVYLEDVQLEIASLKQRLLRISLLIISVIIAMLVYMLRQSLIIERKRRNAENDLKLSQQKYKSLVEASTEGTIMMMGEKVIFANLKMTEMIGSSSIELQKMKFEDIFDLEWKTVLTQFTDPNKSVNLEAKMKVEGNTLREVIISVSKVDYASDSGYIVIAKNITRQKKLEKGSAELSRELQVALSLMNQPIRSYIREIITCGMSATIREAAALMTRKTRDVIFVQQNNQIIGTLNERDLKTRVLAAGLSDATEVSAVMTSPVVSISDDALMYEALLLFKEKDVLHLLVNNIGDENIGMINYFDVLTMQHNSLNYMIKEIKVAEDVETLNSIHGRMPVLVNALLETGDKTGNITHIITSLSDALTIRIVELTVEKLGTPPCDFAFIAMGSEGRREQTLSTDQDNAIVFENVTGELLQEAFQYFRKFGKEVNTKLNQVGFRFCKGEIMAMNPKWSQPVDIWKAYFTDWIKSSDPQSIMDSSIFFDLRCIYGNCDFVDQLLGHIHHQVDNQAAFFQHLANPIIKFKSRLSMFGNIVGDKEGGESKIIDIKKIQLPIVGFSRIYALKHKLHETNTLARIGKLHSLGLINKEFYEELTLSYGVLMQLRLRFQSQSELNNLSPDNMVDIGQLTSIEVSTLKKILSVMENLQTQVSFDFKGGV